MLLIFFTRLIEVFLYILILQKLSTFENKKTLEGHFDFLSLCLVLWVTTTTSDTHIPIHDWTFLIKRQFIIILMSVSFNHFYWNCTPENQLRRNWPLTKTALNWNISSEPTIIRGKIQLPSSQYIYIYNNVHKLSIFYNKVGVGVWY